MVTLFRRQETVVKKSRHQCAIDNDFNVFRYYCPVYLWKKRKKHKKTYVIFEDKVVAWRSEAVILRRERSSAKNGVRACLGFVCFGFLFFTGYGANIDTLGFSDRSTVNGEMKEFYCYQMTHHITT